MLGLKPEMILVKEGARVRSKSDARRCLFGPVDHVEIRDTLQKEMAYLDAENCSKYNFDFSKERPMDGPYNWTPVKQCDFVPIAYKMADFQNMKVLSDYSKFLNLGTIAEEPSQPKPVRRILKPRLRRPMSELPANAGELLVEAAAKYSQSEDRVRITNKRKQSHITGKYFNRSEFVVTIVHMHWNWYVAILMRFSVLSALKVVKMTTHGTASDANNVKVINFAFLCIGGVIVMWNRCIGRRWG